jgi:hypothetical protein
MEKPAHLRINTQNERLAGRLISLTEDTAEIQLCTGDPKPLGSFKNYISPRKENQTNLPEIPAYSSRVRWGQCVEESGEPHSVLFDSVTKAWISEVNIPVSLLATIGSIAVANAVTVGAALGFSYLFYIMFSCPLVYVVAGNGDIALIGEAFTGAVGQQFERTDMLRLPSEEQKLQVLIANESKEVEFIDLAQLILIDSDASSRAVPTHEAEIVLVGEAMAPRSVLDMFGEQTNVLLQSDGRTWSSDLLAAAGEDELVVREWLMADFGAMGKNHALLLELRNTKWSNIVAGEIYRAQGGQLDKLMERAGKNKGEKLRNFRKEAGFDLLVEAEKDGRWQEIATIPSVGPAGFREVAVPLPDSEDSHRYRISGGIGFWELDRIAMVKNLGTPTIERIVPTSAQLGDVDVSSLLSEIDGQRAVQNEGQENRPAFFAATTPRWNEPLGIFGDTWLLRSHRNGW